MTISSTDRKDGPYNGTGALATYPFGFKVFKGSDVVVVRADTATGVETPLAYPADYSVALNANQNVSPGGTITLTAGNLAVGLSVTITSAVPELQPTDYTNLGGFYPSVVTTSFDRATIQIQQLSEILSRALTIPISTPGAVSTALPSPVANNLIGWNPTADALKNIDPTTLATIVAFGTANADQFTGDSITTSFVLTANPGSLNNLDVSIADGTQYPGRDYTWDGDKTITFTSPPPAPVVPGDKNVLVRYLQGLPQGVSDSAASQFIQAGTGAVQRTAQDKMREISVSVLDYAGVDPTGVADSTTAFLNAFATGRRVKAPAGRFKLTNQINLSTIGQVFEGAGREATVLVIPATFNLSATGVFRPTVQSCEFRNFSIEFTQPDTSVRASLVAYPPAFDLYAIPGTVVDNVRIVAAKTVFEMRNNSGQSTISNVICSFFDYGARLDGAIDSVRFNSVHFWPVGLTANQQSIMTSNATIGLDIGRADDLKGAECLFFCGTPINAYAGAGGGCFATFSNCDLDGFRGLVISAGDISFVGGFQSAGNSSAQKLIQTGGRVTYSGVTQLIATTGFTTANPWMSISSGICNFVGGTIRSDTNDANMFNVGGSGSLTLCGVDIVHAPNLAFAQPFIYAQNGARVMAIGNRPSNLGTGSAVFFQNVTDGLHVVTGNCLLGHTMSIAGTQGVFNNNGTVTNLAGNVVIGSVKTLRLTGNLTAGAATVPHGVSGMQTKVIRAAAYGKGAGGEAAPLTITSVDGTNVYVSGGIGTNPYRITIDYLMLDQSPW